MPKLITLKVGKKQIRAKPGITPAQILKRMPKEFAERALSAKYNGELIDLNRALDSSGEIQFLTFEDADGKAIYWHSTAHVLAQAVLRLYPDALPTIGPAIEDGFYYDFGLLKISKADLEKIQAEIAAIIAADLPFERIELSLDQAKALFSKNPYKLELIGELAEEGKPIIAYKQGEFIDLCAGPHIPRTGLIGAVALTNIAAAYWRGDPERQQLTRIYGISFPSKAQLEGHLKLLKELVQRDHRVLGQRLGLWMFSELAPGSPFLLHKGTVLLNELIAMLREKLTARGYVEIVTPFLLNKRLWVQSGHWEHYKDNMFLTKIGAEEYALRPMNCPGAILVYKSRQRSYRELPMRIAEFGVVYRAEASGALTGLLRVRKITMDDAHIFCTEGQIEGEIKGLIGLAKEVYSLFGFDFSIELSTRPESYMGRLELWDAAEAALKSALRSAGVDYRIAAGKGAFYGPKIDWHIKDCLGRSWQCATIQLDFQTPERFGLSYIAEDGAKVRPVIIHRAILGSIERFLAVLTEHTAGKFPLWLSPEQVRILTLSEKYTDWAKAVLGKLLEAGIRASLDARPETLDKKVREAQLDQVNYMLVVGARESASQTVNVRTRENVVKGEMQLEEFIAKAKEEISSRSFKPLL